jgi:hypothetical protein
MNVRASRQRISGSDEIWRSGWPMNELSIGSGVLKKNELWPVDSKVVDAINTHSQRVLIEIGVIPDTTWRESDVVSGPLLDVLALEDLIEKPFKVTQRVVSQIEDSESGEVLADAAEAFAGEVDAYVSAFSAFPIPTEIWERDSEWALREMTRSNVFGDDFDRMNEKSDLLKAQFDRIRQFKLEQQTLLFLYWRAIETQS